MIDAAVAGLLPLDVSGASNVILTFTNGSPSQTDNAIFVFSGVLTGNINVLFPNGKTKLFMVKNSTTGAFALSLGVNASGVPAGSVAVIPAGATGIFYSDGTNVFSAFPTTFVSPTFTGTMTMPDGSTWTSTGLIGVAKLGVAGAVGVNGYTPGQNGYAFGVIGDSINTGKVTGGASGSNAWALLNSISASVAIVQAVVSGGASPANLAIYLGASFSSQYNTDGSFTVGGSTPAGAGAITATGNITAFVSDDRLKTRLGPIDCAIEKVMSLDAFYWEPNQTALDLKIQPGRYVGLSAQQVKRVQPETVTQAPVDAKYMTIWYDKLIPLLVAAMKEQQAQITQLRAEIAAK